MTDLVERLRQAREEAAGLLISKSNLALEAAAEIGRLRIDAARYDHLRNWLISSERRFQDILPNGAIHVYTAAEVDAAVDAAMKDTS